MSAFRDIFERFQNGTATEEETALIREEIEKHEAIEGYIADEFDRMLPEIPKENEAFAGKRISRKVHLRILGMVLLVLAVIGLLVFAGICICDRYFYDPNEGIQPHYGSDGQLMLDMWAFNELHSPEYTTTGAEAWRDSPGCYQVLLYQTNLMTGAQETVMERIAYGKAERIGGEYALTAYWRLPLANAFGYREGKMYEEKENGDLVPWSSGDQWQLDALKELPSSCQASVYITFPKDLELREFAALYEKWRDRELYFMYAAVAGNDGAIMTTTGFSPTGSGIVLQNEPEEYPYFQILDHNDEIDRNLAGVWEKHFRDLLTYLSNREPFLEAMASVNGISPEDYREILSYIDQNGVNVYGVLLSGDVKSILSFMEEETAVDFYVHDVRLSVLSGN